MKVGSGRKYTTEVREAAVKQVIDAGRGILLGQRTGSTGAAADR